MSEESSALRVKAGQFLLRAVVQILADPPLFALGDAEHFTLKGFPLGDVANDAGEEAR